ncbi:cell wall hydrolase [Clostridium massiliamazoniense]|uniref:cell wall hydrolase n=1 Tax=Clostridium massiliamazoniense TaxID=1347366 RepID=UPI0006D7B579|nr:cell wall hydrolase [Clostridium massiliamazoniense]
MKKKYFFNFLLTFSLIIITNLFFNTLTTKPTNLKGVNNEKNINKINTTLLVANGSNNESKELYLENEDTVQVFKSNDKSISLSQSDIDLLAQIVHAESKGEPYTGKVAVASVVLNRVVSPGFPDTVEGVVKQKNAFSCVVNGQINVVPNSDSYNAVKDAIRGIDPTNQALYFYNPKIATCNWMKNVSKKNVKSIGQHVFFKV